jgi:hypothetical protein
MLVEGALGVLPRGFEIFVKSESFETETLQELFDSSPDGANLPDQIRNKVRFTIAHELAHTLFYNRNHYPPRRLFAVSNANVRKALEKRCNELAATFLLPKAALRARFAGAEFHDPDTLNEIAAAGSVAKSVVIIRLPELDIGIEPRSIIATVHWDEGRFCVEHIWRHYSFNSRFPGLVVGKPLLHAFECEELLDLRVCGGYFDKVGFDLTIGGHEERWNLAVERFTSPTTREPFFISLYRPIDVAIAE